MRRLGIVLCCVLGAAFLAGTVQALVPSDPQASHPTYAALNLPAAWDVTTGSPRVVIAIVDSGIDATQPDLAGALRPGYDFVSRDGDATDPPGGHGTAVAGVAAARANNGFGGMGTCFSCDLMPLRVLGPDGIAFNTNTAAAIDYAVDHGAAVVNASIYGPHSPPTLRDAIVRARAAGVLVVAAAGNEGTTQEQFPAAFPEAISVGAAKGNTLAPYSSFGSWLKFAAPECAPVTAIGGGTDVGCATSVASPLVAGIVALLRAHAPYASADELEDALARTARPIPGARHGLIDAAAALAALGRPEPKLRPVVIGTPVVGRPLEAFSGLWSGAGIAVTYRWERCRRRVCADPGRHVVALHTGRGRLRPRACGSSSTPPESASATSPTTADRRRVSARPGAPLDRRARPCGSPSRRAARSMDREPTCASRSPGSAAEGRAPRSRSGRGIASEPRTAATASEPPSSPRTTSAPRSARSKPTAVVR